MLVSNFADRLNEAIIYRGIKPAEIVRISEKLFASGKINKALTKPLLSNYLKGSYEAKQDNVYALSLILNVDEAWLMGYDVSMHTQNKLDEFGNPVVSIPLLGTVKAGYDYLAQENWEGTIDIKEELAKTGEFFALRIKGNSMFETLWDGDIVAVKKQDFAKDGDIAVVLINGDEATVKKIRILDNGIKLMPLNRRINPETQEPYYEDITFTKEEIETKPVKVVGIVRRLIERDFK